jgi:phosphoribosylanthranilate isomerase
MSTWIKVCGTTNLGDARIAVNAGADALGFIFAPSPRQVKAEQVRPITDQVRDIDRIGLFVNETPDNVEDIFKRAGLTGVQLHGDESQEQVLQIRKRLRSHSSMPQVIKTVRFTPAIAEELARFSDPALVDAILIDTFSPHARGGTGTTFAWEEAQEIVRCAEMPIIVAGGLNPENVQQALAMLNPWGVDAVSGLESAPGRKDVRKVEAFCAAVRNFDTAEDLHVAKERN